MCNCYLASGEPCKYKPKPDSFIAVFINHVKTRLRFHRRKRRFHRRKRRFHRRKRLAHPEKNLIQKILKNVLYPVNLV